MEVTEFFADLLDQELTARTRQSHKPATASIAEHSRTRVAAYDQLAGVQRLTLKALAAIRGQHPVTDFDVERLQRWEFPPQAGPAGPISFASTSQRPVILVFLCIVPKHHAKPVANTHSEAENILRTSRLNGASASTTNE